MITPYDWQEGIANRAQYIEGKLKQGAPVLAVSIDAGILVYTMHRQSRKIFEIYDRLLFSAVGQQSDVEALRSAAVEFAHQEGYARSEQDVTIQRVITALSGSVKKAFSDFQTAPLVARSVFAEVGETVGDDVFYVLDYDGDYAITHGYALVAGAHEAVEPLRERLENFDRSQAPEAALETLRGLWLEAMAALDDTRSIDEIVRDLTPEALLLERSNTREDRFRIL